MVEGSHTLKEHSKSKPLLCCGHILPVKASQEHWDMPSSAWGAHPLTWADSIPQAKAPRGRFLLQPTIGEFAWGAFLHMLIAY